LARALASPRCLTSHTYLLQSQQVSLDFATPSEPLGLIFVDRVDGVVESLLLAMAIERPLALLVSSELDQFDNSFPRVPLCYAHALKTELILFVECREQQLLLVGVFLLRVLETVALELLQILTVALCDQPRSALLLLTHAQ
jgi:hypothetical protein